MPFVTTQMDLEGIMLSEINHTGKDKYYMISLTCSTYTQYQQKETKNLQVKEKRIRFTVTRGGKWGREEIGGTWSKGTKFWL